MIDYEVISSRQEAMAAWDKTSVIIREDDGYYFVYPLLGRGYKYPTFDLKRQCCLNTFLSEQKAIEWAEARGYKFSILNNSKRRE